MRHTVSAALILAAAACGPASGPPGPAATPQRQTTAKGPPEVVIVQPPNQGSVPDAEVGEDGVVHVAYLAGDDVLYTTWRAATFSESIPINSDAATAAGGAFRGPDLALGQQGRVHAIWYSNAYASGRPDLNGVHYARKDPTAQAFERSRNLNGLPSDNYSIAADGHGAVAVFWTAEGLFVQRSHDGGDNFEPPSPIGGGVDPCECCATRSAFSEDGQLHCLYRDQADSIRDVYLLSGATEGDGFSRIRLELESWKIEACPMSGSFLHAGSRGLVATWRQRNDILFASGAPPKTVQVPGEGVRRYPIALSGPDGTVVVAWKEATTLQWQAFDSSGRPLGSPTATAVTTGDRGAGVVLPDGRFVLFG